MDKQPVDIKSGWKLKRILRRRELSDAVEGVWTDMPVLTLTDEIPSVHTLLHGIRTYAEGRRNIVGIETGITHLQHLSGLHGLNSRDKIRTARGGMFGQDAPRQRTALANHVGNPQSVEQPRLQASVAIVLRDIIDIAACRVTLQRYTEQLPYPLAVAVKRGARQRRPVIHGRLGPFAADSPESRPPVKARNRIHKPNISLYDG